MKVEVISKVCGSGKSTGMIEKIKSDKLLGSDDLYVYITPYISGCHDIAGTTAIIGDEYQRPLLDSEGKVIYTPTERNLGNLKFKHPSNRNKFGTKAEGLRYLMDNNQNIVSTHNLFLDINLDTLDNASQYTLVIDEALDIYDKCNIIPDAEVKQLLIIGILYFKDDGITLGFDREKFGDSNNLLLGGDTVRKTYYEPLANLCDNSQILIVKGNVLIWEFSSEILKRFKKVYILSYLFEGREMSTYLKKHNIEYTVTKGDKGGAYFKDLVDIIQDPKLNSIGDNYFDLSASQTRVKRKSRVEPDSDLFEDNEKYLSAKNRYDNYMNGVTDKSISAEKRTDELRKNLHTVMNSRWKAKSNDRYFTCISANKKVIAGKNYTLNWLPYSIRATNKYIETSHVAFLMNMFMQPAIKDACDSGEFKVDEDLVSLSHLVQFIFRSRLRNEEPIKVYVPSSRMRGLLEDYLKGLYD